MIGPSGFMQTQKVKEGIYMYGIQEEYRAPINENILYRSKYHCRRFASMEVSTGGWRIRLKSNEDE